jgi:hypothetical protein
VHGHGDGLEEIPRDRLSRHKGHKGQAVFGSWQDTRDRLFLVHGGDLKEPVPDFDAISKWVGVAVLFLIQG